MTLYFSASTKACYDDRINKNIPADKVEITQAEHAAFVGAQGNATITADSTGKPAVTPFTAAQKAAQQVLSIKAQLAALDRFIPRALEDTWSVMGFDTTKLNAVQQGYLSQKQALRAELATAAAASAPATAASTAAPATSASGTAAASAG